MPLKRSRPWLSVVIPTLNEGKAIAGVIRDVRKKLGRGTEVVIVDSSTDGTDRIAEEAGARVIRQPRQGYGKAVKAGLLAARGDLILTLDGDGTYPLEAFPRFLKEISKGADVVSGSRIAGGMEKGAMPFYRQLGNWFLAFLTSALYLKRVTDATTGMRLYRRDVIHAIEWKENVALSLELLFKPIKNGFRVVEVPIRYCTRVGKSKLNPLAAGIEMAWAVVKYRFVD